MNALVKVVVFSVLAVLPLSPDGATTALAATGLPPIDPCPEIQFAVQFADGSAEIEGEMVDLVDAGAARAKFCEIGDLVVRGYADTPALAERRARAVRDAMLSRGVKALSSEIVVCSTRSSYANRAIADVLYPMPSHPIPDTHIPC